MRGPDPALAAVLRSLRLQNGISQENLAFEANVTIATLSRMERGVTNPAWTSVCSVVRALDLSMGELAAAVELEQQGPLACPVVSHHR